MTYTVDHPTNSKFFTTANPITQIYHHGEIEPTQRLDTNQPFMVVKDSTQDSLDLLFSDIQYDEDNEFDLGASTKRDITWLKNYTESEAQSTVDNVNSFGFIFVKKIKHPDRDEYSIPFQAYVLSQIPDGPVKDGFSATYAQKVADGHHKTTNEMQLDGWF